jgi:hypothetical protein
VSNVRESWFWLSGKTHKQYTLQTNCICDDLEQVGRMFCCACKWSARDTVYLLLCGLMMPMLIPEGADL